MFFYQYTYWHVDINEGFVDAGDLKRASDYFSLLISISVTLFYIWFEHITVHDTHSSGTLWLIKYFVMWYCMYVFWIAIWHDFMLLDIRNDA